MRTPNTINATPQPTDVSENAKIQPIMKTMNERTLILKYLEYCGFYCSLKTIKPLHSPHHPGDSWHRAIKPRDRRHH